MKKILLLLSMPFFCSCQHPTPGRIHTFQVPNRLEMISKDTLAFVLTNTPPSDLYKLVLGKDDSVFVDLNWPAAAKTGDKIKIPFKFRSGVHYNIFAVGTDMQHTYYELDDHDFTVEGDKVIMYRH